LLRHGGLWLGLLLLGVCLLLTFLLLPFLLVVLVLLALLRFVVVAAVACGREGSHHFAHGGNFLFLTLRLVSSSTFLLCTSTVAEGGLLLFLLLGVKN